MTEVGEYILTEYVRADGERYGLLLDQNLEILADLPDLCDYQYFRQSTTILIIKMEKLGNVICIRSKSWSSIGKNYR